MATLPIVSPGSILELGREAGTVIDGVSRWLEQRERRIEAEARLDHEVKVQKMRRTAYANELKINLKALKEKIEANNVYLRAQMTDRDQARQHISEEAARTLDIARELVVVLAKQDLSEMPSKTLEKISGDIVDIVSRATKLIEKFPSDPLATLA